MKVNEIFYSIQGEGGRAGEPSIFIRLAECDLECSFCDTEFESGKEMATEEVLEYISQYPCRWIVWTGGEPALQLTEEIIKFFRTHGYKQAIETNGNHKLPHGLDWITVSPKVAEHVLRKNFPNGVTELRYVRHKGKPDIPKPSIKAQHYFISPLFDGDKPNWENITHCIKLCLENPQWKLSVQLHKFLKIL